VSRALWFVAGAGAGVYAVARARRAAEWLTPEGLADRLAGLSVGLHLVGEEVRAGMAEREADLRGRRLELTSRGRPPALPEVGEQASTEQHPPTSTREGHH
jgi:hypothetical protein